MQMCDKLGLLTSVEIPVVNAITQSKAFMDNCVEQVTEMVCQNYNCLLYTSSTENAAGNQAYWVRFGKSGADAGNKTATNRFVRCMLTIVDYTYPEEPGTLTVNPNPVTLEGANEAEANVTLTSNKTVFRLVEQKAVKAFSDKSSEKIDEIYVFTPQDTGDMENVPFFPFFSTITGSSLP